MFKLQSYPFLIFLLLTYETIPPVTGSRRINFMTKQLTTRDLSLGIFSSCRKYSSSVEILHIKSRLIQEASKFYFTRPEGVVDHLQFDVCDSTDEIIRITTGLLLDNTNNRKNSNADPERRAPEQNVAFIIVSLSERQASLVASLLSTTDINIVGIDVKKESSILGYFNTFHSFLCKFRLREKSLVLALLDVFKWKHVHLIDLDNTWIYRTYKNLLYHSLKKHNKCFDSKTVKGAKDLRALATITNSPDDNMVFILLGEKKNQLKFIQQMHSNFGHSFQWLTYNLGQETPFIDISRTDNSLEERDDDVSYFLKDFLKPSRKDARFGITGTWLDMMFNYLTYLEDCYRLVSRKSVDRTKTFGRQLMLQGLVRYLTFVNRSSGEVLLSTSDLDILPLQEIKEVGKELIKETKCNKKKCSAGKENFLGKIRWDWDQPWDWSYKWSCMLCESNHYKNMTGYGECRKCEEPTISNANRTSCYDPYKDVYISLSSMFITFALSVSGVALVITILVMGVFLIYRHTPLARSCDLKLTWLHLMVVLAFHLLAPFAYMLKPTSSNHCYLRLVTVSVLHVLNLSIVLVKSEKLVKAFNSTVKVNRSGVKRTQAFQCLFVLLLLLLANLLLAVISIEKPVKVVTITDPLFLERVHRCNTTPHTNVLIFYSAILELACLVQAFRGRKLPNSYNDSISYVYGAFITTIGTVVFASIFCFQDNVLHKQTLQIATVVVNNAALLIFTYGHKVYLMVFLPHLNSAESLREEHMEIFASRSIKTQTIIQEETDC